MIKNEFRKYILKPAVLICTIVFFALDFVKVYEIYYYLNSGRSLPDYNIKGQNAIHAAYGGEITDEKIAALKADLDKANRLLGKYGYVEAPIEGTYTGFPSLDNILLTYKIEDYRYAILYANTSHQIQEDALRNVEFYTGKNDYDKRENELIAELYGGRTVDKCIVQSGWNAFFDYKFSVLLCMLLIVLALSPMVSGERESGFYRIINSSGRRKSVLAAKFIAAGAFTASVCGVFLITDLLYTHAIYRTDGLLAPLYALKCYELCPFDTTLLGGILLAFLARLTFLLCYAFLVLLISSLCESNTLSMLISMCAGFILVITAEFLPADISPTSLVGMHEEFSAFKTVNLFGFPVLSVYAAFALTIIPTVIFALATFLIGLKSDVALKKRVKHNAL